MLRSLLGLVVGGLVVLGCTPCPPGQCGPDASTAGGGAAGGNAAGGTAMAGGAAAGGTAMAGGAAAGGTAMAGGAAAGGTAIAGGAAAGGTAMAGGAAGGGTGVNPDGGCATGTLRPLGSVLDFGERPTGCTATLALTVQNLCPAPQTLSLSANAPFGADAGIVSVPAGGAIDLPITFSPPTLGPRQGVVTATTSSGANLVIALRGTGSAPGDVTDTFPGQTFDTRDTLFIVSDGPGMGPAQQSLAAAAPGLVMFANSTAVDFAFAALIGRRTGGGLVQGSMGAPLLVTPLTPSAGVRLSEKFVLGQSGAPTTSCLSRAVEHFSADAGWLRPNANLELLCVQNTLEQLPGDTSAWLALLRAATGKTRTQLTVSSIANFTRACPGPDDGPLSSAARATFGSTETICTPDGGLALAGLVPASVRQALFLSRPGPEDGGVDLRFDAVPVSSTFRDAGVWTFDAERNAVVFAPLQAPDSSKTVTVRYRPACVP